MSILTETLHSRVYLLLETPDHLLENARCELMRLDETEWKASTMFGHSSRRLQCTVGKSYRFGNTTFPAIPFGQVPAMGRLADYFGTLYDCTFGMAHLNIYPDQHVQPVCRPAKLGWHADDEKVLDPDVPIVCISFGEPMRVRFKPNTCPSTVTSLETGHKQVYVMAGAFQQEFLHCVTPLTKKRRQEIPADPSFFGARWSITFRGLARTIE